MVASRGAGLAPLPLGRRAATAAPSGTAAPQCMAAWHAAGAAPTTRMSSRAPPRPPPVPPACARPAPPGGGAGSIARSRCKIPETSAMFASRRPASSPPAAAPETDSASRSRAPTASRVEGAPSSPRAYSARSASRSGIPDGGAWGAGTGLKMSSELAEGWSRYPTTCDTTAPRESGAGHAPSGEASATSRSLPSSAPAPGPTGAGG
mmetsp:Transcript_6895/g.24084  ORF Transcript_6895/g.24084 Transcript_6895/m.24084 type:complete len:207 (-) Transcript_6895:475-1095(-)